MKQLTICFCVIGKYVLLARKRVGFGEGKRNGYGGKLKTGETPEGAAIRELEEESGLQARSADLKKVALLTFRHGQGELFQCHVYLLNRWSGKLKDTEEMDDPNWYPISDLPFQEMWAADANWVPLILNGEKIEAEVHFSIDGSVVTEFNYKPTEFE